MQNMIHTVFNIFELGGKHANRDPLGKLADDEARDGSVLLNLAVMVLEVGHGVVRIVDKHESRYFLAELVVVGGRGGEGRARSGVELDGEALRASGGVERQLLDRGIVRSLADGDAESVKRRGDRNERLGGRHGTLVVVLVILGLSGFNAGESEQGDERQDNEDLHYDVVCTSTYSCQRRRRGRE